jgi:hypothetical protein
VAAWFGTKRSNRSGMIAGVLAAGLWLFAVAIPVLTVAIASARRRRISQDGDRS